MCSSFNFSMIVFCSIDVNELLLPPYKMLAVLSVELSVGALNAIVSIAISRETIGGLLSGRNTKRQRLVRSGAGYR